MMSKPRRHKITPKDNEKNLIDVLRNVSANEHYDIYKITVRQKIIVIFHNIIF